jgi:hypothetical protein
MFEGHSSAGFSRDQDFLFTTLQNTINMKINSIKIRKVNAHKETASCCKKTVLITREMLHEYTKPIITLIFAQFHRIHSS